jgi:hypothetical protein
VAEDKSTPQEAVQGLRSVFERVGEFFHLFDLSFFVSGSVLFGAFAFLYIKLQLSRAFPFADWVAVAALILGVYVCGLLAFAGGRLLNGKLFRRPVLHYTLLEAIELHDLESGVIKAYLGDRSIRRVWRLYIRMWAEVAHRQPTSVAYHHLSRYWVMAATYDGVGFALFVWAIIVFSSQFAMVPSPLSPWLANIGAVLLVGAGILALKRGAAYYEYQVEDVVAELATIKSPLL